MNFILLIISYYIIIHPRICIFEILLSGWCRTTLRHACLVSNAFSYTTNTEVFSNEMFRYSETKTSTENLDTPPPPPLIQTFSVPEISETLKGSPPTKIFGTVRQKISDRKS